MLLIIQIRHTPRSFLGLWNMPQPDISLGIPNRTIGALRSREGLIFDKHVNCPVSDFQDDVAGLVASDELKATSVPGIIGKVLRWGASKQR